MFAVVWKLGDGFFLRRREILRTSAESISSISWDQQVNKIYEWRIILNNINIDINKTQLDFLKSADSHYAIYSNFNVLLSSFCCYCSSFYSFSNILAHLIAY